MYKGQSNWRSFLEANMNTFIGLLLNLLLSPWVYTAVGMKYTWIQIGLTTLFFTIISIARGYVIRRFFNKHEKNKEQKLLDELTGYKQLLDDTTNMIGHIRLESSNWRKLYESARKALSQRTTELAELQEKYNILEAFYNTSQADNLKLGEENERLREEVDLQVHNRDAFMSDLKEGIEGLNIEQTSDGLDGPY